MAHGPTNHYGKAQWNGEGASPSIRSPSAADLTLLATVVLRAIHVLRDTFFGWVVLVSPACLVLTCPVAFWLTPVSLPSDYCSDGPVFNLDDDCRIVPELLDKIWKLKKAVVWQVGNYPCKTWDSWCEWRPGGGALGSPLVGSLQVAPLMERDSLQGRDRSLRMAP